MQNGVLKGTQLFLFFVLSLPIPENIPYSINQLHWLTLTVDCWLFAMILKGTAQHFWLYVFFWTSLSSVSDNWSQLSSTVLDTGNNWSPMTINIQQIILFRFFVWFSSVSSVCWHRQDYLVTSLACQHLTEKLNFDDIYYCTSQWCTFSTNKIALL